MIVDWCSPTCKMYTLKLRWRRDDVDTDDVEVEHHIKDIT
jgi:hypothetical protein